MKTDQNLQIDELNAILIEERGKITRLIHDVGNDDSGLIRRLNDLEIRV